MKTKLTMAQRARLMYLSRKRDSAPASERKEIQEEIDTLLGRNRSLIRSSTTLRDQPAQPVRPSPTPSPLSLRLSPKTTRF